MASMDLKVQVCIERVRVLCLMPMMVSVFLIDPGRCILASWFSGIGIVTGVASLCNAGLL